MEKTQKRKRKCVSFYSSQEWDTPRVKRYVEHEVEYIEKMRLYKGQTQFYIKWKGFPDEENSWEPQKNLKNCSQALKEFEKRQRASGHNGEIIQALPEVSAEVETCTDENRSALTEQLQVKKILKAMSYSTTELDGERELNVIFKVLRSDGMEVLMDNKFLRDKYPYLLLDFYEQRVRHK